MSANRLPKFGPFFFFFFFFFLLLLRRWSMRCAPCLFLPCLCCCAPSCSALPACFFRCARLLLCGLRLVLCSVACVPALTEMDAGYAMELVNFYGCGGLRLQLLVREKHRFDNPEVLSNLTSSSQKNSEPKSPWDLGFFSLTLCWITKAKAIDNL